MSEEKTEEKVDEQPKKVVKKRIKPIRVWEYKDAPKKYKKLVNSESAVWIAFVPKGYLWTPWLDTKEYKIFVEYDQNGKIYIGFKP